MLGGVLGVAVLFAVSLAPVLARTRNFRVAFAAMAVAVVAVGAVRIRMEQAETKRIEAMVRVPPAEKTMLLAGSDGRS